MKNCCSRLFKHQFSDMTVQLNDKDQEIDQVETNNSAPESGIKALFKLNSHMDLHKGSSLETGIASRSKLVIKEEFPHENILRLQNLFFEELNRHYPTLTKIKDTSFENFPNVSSFAENVNKETGFEKVSVLHQTFRTNFRAEFVFFGFMNQIVPIYQNIDEYELVQFEAYEDVIFMIERVRTQRILVISPRQVITLRVIRKLGAGRFLDVSQSIEFNELIKFPSLKSLYEEKVVKEPGAIMIAGYYLEDSEDDCMVTSFSKLDFHMTTPLKFAAIFIRKSIDSYFEKLAANLAQHLDTDSWNDGKDVKWFKNSKSENFIEPDFVKNKELAKFPYRQPQSENSSAKQKVSENLTESTNETENSTTV